MNSLTCFFVNCVTWCDIYSRNSYHASIPIIFVVTIISAIIGINAKPAIFLKVKITITYVLIAYLRIDAVLLISSKHSLHYCEKKSMSAG